MITPVVSSLFQSPAKVLVNTVNTVGVMGKGIAKEFKYFYPEMFVEYQRLCERNQFQIGQLWLYKTSRKWVLNFPTKKHWRQPSRLDDIEAGLKTFVNTYAEEGINSISFPMLGCGNGELEWEVVRPVMEKYLKNVPIEIFLHLRGRDPFAPEHHDPVAMKQWLRSEPESLAFAEFWDDLCAAIAKQREFRTFNTNEIFTAAIVNQPDNAIQIETGEKSIVIYQDAILDLWQQIRSSGFCMERTMPSGLDRDAPHIIALLASLAYLMPILLTERPTQLSGGDIGLRLMPGPRRVLAASPRMSVRQVERV